MLISTIYLYKLTMQIFKSKSSIRREDVFLTSKLLPGDMRSRESVRNSVTQSLRDFRTYYLVHFPGPGHLSRNDPKNAECRKYVWEELEQLYK